MILELFVCKACGENKRCLLGIEGEEDAVSGRLPNSCPYERQYEWERL